MGSVKYMYGSGSFTIYVSIVTRKHICFRIMGILTWQALLIVLLRNSGHINTHEDNLLYL